MKITALIKEIEGLLLISFPKKQPTEVAKVIVDQLKKENPYVTIKFVAPQNIKGSFQIRIFEIGE